MKSLNFNPYHITDIIYQINEDNSWYIKSAKIYGGELDKHQLAKVNKNKEFILNKIKERNI